MKSKNLICVAALILFVPTVLASNTWYVNGVSGSDSNTCTSPTTPCKTIGHAISLAVSGETIVVAAATYAEHLTIGKSVTIVGSGATTTIIDGQETGTVVTISSEAAKVFLSGLTIRHGRAPNDGGGIYNNGALTINNSTISGNTAAISCSASFCDNSGGGIYNDGALTINNSTISGNEALIQCTYQCATLGGGIFSAAGTVVINHSTISGNTASASCFSTYPPCRGFFHSDGGGIFNANGLMLINNSTINSNLANESGGVDNRGTLTITNSTISGNRAYFTRGNAFGGGISNGGVLTINNSTIDGNSARGSIGSYGGGIYTSNGTATPTTVQNSIVANSTSGGNCYGTITSNGYNLSTDGSCNFNHAGDLNNHDPLLGPLQNNGGPTDTMALLAGSPAIDGGNPNGCTDGSGHLLTTDQRGQPRPDKEDAHGCDIGAYERQSD